MKDFWEGLKNFLSSLSDSSKIDIYMGFLRQAIPAIGGLCVALGWISSEHMNALVVKILAGTGPILITVGLIWSLLANSAFSVRKAAAKLPENNPQ